MYTWNVMDFFVHAVVWNWEQLLVTKNGKKKSWISHGFNIWYELLTVIISEFFFMSPIEKQVYPRLFNGKKNKSPT